jgi:beta-lactamase class A
MTGRRAWAFGVAALAAVHPVRAETSMPGLAAALARIERERGGRLGAAVLDLATGRAAAYRADERFPMASTFKVFVASAVLARVDAGAERLDRPIRFTRADLVPWSPVAEAWAERGGSLPVSALLDAMVTMSDNAATNLLLASIGGPPGLTAFLSGPLRDAVTRSDRDEPAMSEGRPGDERDTSSPAAFLASLRALTLGDALSPASRERLLLLMLANQTSARLLRAHLPLGWRIADRTGAAGHRTANIVGLLWPPGRIDPALFAVFHAEGPPERPQRDAALVEVGAAIVAALAIPG